MSNQNDDGIILTIHIIYIFGIASVYITSSKLIKGRLNRMCTALAQNLACVM